MKQLTYDNNLKLLQEIIENIDNKNSNNNQIKKLLLEIEKVLTLIYQTKYNEVIKNKIRIINNKTIANLYKEDLKTLENKLINLKQKLEEELYKLNPNLIVNLTLDNTNNKKELIINSNTKTTIQEIFNKISINDFIKNIDLEELQKMYLKELSSDPFEEKYMELFIAIENKEIARYNNYPILRVIKKIKKYYPNKYDELENQSLKVADLFIKKLQLENLNKSINLYGFTKTSNYINKVLDNINKIIESNNTIISKVIKNIIPNKHIYGLTNEESKQIVDILTELLRITRYESQIICSYQDNGEFFEEATKDYQRFLLSTRYNIDFSLENLIKELKEKSNQTPINKAPKTKLIKKIKKINIIKRKK